MTEAPRRSARAVSIGGLAVGGDAPVRVEGMVKTRTSDAQATVAEIRALAAAGAELVRLAVPDREAAGALPAIAESAPVPLMADIHFDAELALAALDAGCAAIRVNPGTLPASKDLALIVRAAVGAHAAIRIGVNAGSLPPSEGTTAERMADALRRQVEAVTALGAEDLILSMKSFDIPALLEAHRLCTGIFPHPFHIGVTEAGPPPAGLIRSAAGIALLLHEGFGDALRVSLTAPAVDEVRAGYTILAALGLRRRGPEIVACPTCGRCDVDLEPIVAAVAARVAGRPEAVRIALMGCEVNGPGEAREADLGIAFGRARGVLFRRGDPVETVPPETAVDRLLEALDGMNDPKPGVEG